MRLDGYTLITNAVIRLIKMSSVFRATSVWLQPGFAFCSVLPPGSCCTPLSFVPCLQACCQHLLGTPEAASSCIEVLVGRTKTRRACAAFDPDRTSVFLCVRASAASYHHIQRPTHSGVFSVCVTYVAASPTQWRRACNLFCWIVMVCRPCRRLCDGCSSLHLPVQPDISAFVSVAAQLLAVAVPLDVSAFLVAISS